MLNTTNTILIAIFLLLPLDQICSQAQILNRFTDLWCQVTENSAIQGVQHNMCFFAWRRKQSRIPKGRASLKIIRWTKSR
jgi:hypothetical protein